MKRLILLGVAFIAVSFATDGAAAAVIASYDAARDGRPEVYADDPTNQGWTSYYNTLGDPTLNTSGHVAGPVDVTGGYQGTVAPLAWRINDQGGSAPQYRQPITSYLDLMASNPAGWKLESDVRFNTSTYQFGFFVADADWDIGDQQAYWFRAVSSAPSGGNLVLNIGSAGNVNTGIAYDPNKFYNVVLESVFTDPYRYTVTIDGTKLAGSFAPLAYSSSSSIQGALFGSNSSGGTGIIGDMAAYQLTAPSQRVLFSHYGANDPTTEGWTLVDTSAGQLNAQAVLNDGGYDAWRTTDNSTAAGNLNYQYVPTLLEDEVLVENGWIMRGRIRVEDEANAIDTAVAMQVGLASTSQLFQLGLSVDANDNTIFGLHNGNNFTSVSGSVEGVGYHLYEIVYDPATQTIDLFVDGDELISDFAGRNFANLRQVLFGANSGGGTGTGYYNMVEFVVLPEPGGIVLLLSLLLPVLSLRPRRRPQLRYRLSDN